MYEGCCRHCSFQCSCLSVNTSPELPTRYARGGSELEMVLLDFLSRVATDTPESERLSVNTDVGPDVGQRLHKKQNHSQVYATPGTDEVARLLEI